MTPWRTRSHLRWSDQQVSSKVKNKAKVVFYKSLFADYKEEEEKEDAKADETPSLSFTTETLSSWMREANMDANIQSYTKSSVLRRDEYFFRIWYYASKLFK